MSQSKQVASLTTRRLSPLAKPFTLNPSCSTHQSTLTSKPLFEQNLSLEFPKKLDFDGFNGSQLDTVKDSSLPTYSTRVTALGCTGNEVSYEKQEVDSHESLFQKRDYACSSVAETTMFQKGKHAVDGLNPCLTVPDGIFKKSTGTIAVEDILSNSKGIVPALDEPTSFQISNCKIAPAPLKLSTADIDMSSAKRALQNQSSKNLGDSDSDVDSPCWKGTMAFSQASTEISGSAQPYNVNKTNEKHNSLNPLAPQFFPGIGYVNDYFGSSNSCAPATNSLSGEDSLMATVMAESPVELNKGIELQYSSNNCRRENAFNVFNDPEGNRSKSEVFPAKGHSPTPSLTTSLSQVCVVTDLVKTFEGVSKSLTESPKPDVETIVSAMHILSELLVQNCVNEIESDNNHGRFTTMIMQTINNLNDFRRKVFGDLDSTPTESPFCHNKTLVIPKGFEMTSMETLTVPSQLYPQNDYMRQNIISKGFVKSGQISFASSSNEDADNEIAKVIRRSLGKRLDFDTQMHPEALLFKNLWLDSAAECCYRKYITYRYLMDAGVDVNCTIFNELLR